MGYQLWTGRIETGALGLYWLLFTKIPGQKQLKEGGGVYCG